MDFYLHLQDTQKFDLGASRTNDSLAFEISRHALQTAKLLNAISFCILPPSLFEELVLITPKSLRIFA